MYKYSQSKNFTILLAFVVNISNVRKANNDQPVVQIQTAFFAPSLCHPNGLPQSANKTNSSPLQIKMQASPPLTLAVFAQPTSPVEVVKLRTVLCYRGSCEEQECKDGRGGESHDEEIWIQGIIE